MISIHTCFYATHMDVISGARSPWKLKHLMNELRVWVRETWDTVFHTHLCAGWRCARSLLPRCRVGGERGRTSLVRGTATHKFWRGCCLCYQYTRRSSHIFHILAGWWYENDCDRRAGRHDSIALRWKKTIACHDNVQIEHDLHLGSWLHLVFFCWFCFPWGWRSLFWPKFGLKIMTLQVIAEKYTYTYSSWCEVHIFAYFPWFLRENMTEYNMTFSQRP